MFHICFFKPWDKSTLLAHANGILCSTGHRSCKQILCKVSWTVKATYSIVVEKIRPCVVPARSILLMQLTHVLGSIWTCEQPHSSLLNAHDRFQEMLKNFLPLGIPVACFAFVSEQR